MLKHVVNYTDPLTDEKVTETLHFNFSKAELAEKVMIDQEYGDKLKAIATREDPKELIDTIKEMVREAYGDVVEVNGRKQFRKTAEGTEAFLGSEAYSTFFFELFTDPQHTINFVNGIMPAEFMEGVEVPQVTRRPQPQDRRPKQIKQVELPAEDIQIVGGQELTKAEFVGSDPRDVDVEDNPAQDRLKELEARPLDGLKIDELIELKTLRGDI